jgi:uncharacterized membrane protein
MIKLAHVYDLLGAIFLGAAILNARDRRWAAAAVWAIIAVALVAGDSIASAAKAGSRWPMQAMGAGVIALGVLAAIARHRPPDADAEHLRASARAASAARLGNLLFVPALVIPVLTFALLESAPYLRVGGIWLIDRTIESRVALIGLGTAAAIALIGALVLTRTRPVHAIGEARRLLDTIGWAIVLPITLATLGSVFDKAGVGSAIADLAGRVIPIDSRFACLAVYALGMVGLTVILGNAFAAFPVMTGGIGLPLLITRHGADPAALGALGMLTGYCGTLLTPMAANFNIVPARLLELRDPYGVIRMQWPTALAMLVANVSLLALFAFG